MRLAGIALAAVASLVFSSAPAHAQRVPSPADLLQQMQQMQQQLQQTTSSCPSIEVAPNVRIPICPDAIPKPPPGIVIPEAQLGPLTVLPWVDLRARGLDGPVMNQQQTGVCYAFAITDVLDNSLLRQGRSAPLSPLHFIASGGFGSLFSTTRPEPLAAETSWPYDPIKACKLKAGSDVCESTYHVRTNTWQSDPVIVGERTRARSLGFASVQKATSIATDPANGIARALSMSRAVYLVIGIDSTAWSFSGVRDGYLKDYGTADRGDHAVAVVGYRSAPNGRQYLLHNSWGTSWGDHGYVWITEAGLKKHFSAAYLIEATPSGAGPGPLPSMPALPALPFALPTAPLPALPWPWPTQP